MASAERSKLGWRWFVGLVAGLLLLSGGCSQASSGSGTSQDQASLPVVETLPIGAIVTVGDRQFELEVARTAREQQIGLMFRETLPADRGMVFPFETPRPARFWMFNVQFPLDIIFLSEGEVVEIAASVPGCAAQPCPTYGPASDVLVDEVVEFNGGTAAALGLEVGDELTVVFTDET